MPDVRPAILQEREKTHGDFAVNAAVSQGLKIVLRGSVRWGDLDARQKEAIDMICCKLGRIMAGDAGFAEHWIDLAGYAQLGREACAQ